MIKKLDDLLEREDMYYIGTLVDMDGSTWVPKEMALKFQKKKNEPRFGKYLLKINFWFQLLQFFYCWLADTMFMVI